MKQPILNIDDGLKAVEEEKEEKEQNKDLDKTTGSGSSSGSPSDNEDENITKDAPPKGKKKGKKKRKEEKKKEKENKLYKVVESIRPKTELYKLLRARGKTEKSEILRGQSDENEKNNNNVVVDALIDLGYYNDEPNKENIFKFLRDLEK
jgi:hypothetical protein